MGLQKLGGETMRDKRRRERQELYELRVTEWLVQPRKENIFKCLKKDFFEEMHILLKR